MLPKGGDKRKIPATNFTRTIINTIDRVDSAIFEAFGYRKAARPFSPHSQAYNEQSNQDIWGNKKL